MRFRCDGGPSLRSRATIQQEGAESRASVAGIMGCLQSLRGTSLTDFAEDYADRTVKEIEKMAVAFCTPLGGVLDETLLAKFYSSVRAVVADGALQKVAQYLQKSKMPNIVLISRARHTCSALPRRNRLYDRIVSGNKTGGCSVRAVCCGRCSSQTACRHVWRSASG